jgi:hypothetical protein
VNIYMRCGECGVEEYALTPGALARFMHAHEHAIARNLQIPLQFPAFQGGGGGGLHA